MSPSFQANCQPQLDFKTHDSTSRFVPFLLVKPDVVHLRGNGAPKKGRDSKETCKVKGHASCGTMERSGWRPIGDGSDVSRSFGDATSDVSRTFYVTLLFVNLQQLLRSEASESYR